MLAPQCEEQVADRMEFSIAAQFFASSGVCPVAPVPLSDVARPLPQPNTPPLVLSHSIALAVRSLTAAAALAFAAWVSAQTPEAESVRLKLMQGNLPGALSTVQTALVGKPNDAQLRFLLGVVWMDMGRDAQALELFRQLNQQYPELPEPLNNLGLLQARGGQLESALQSFQAALLADPVHRAARSNLGQVHLMLAVQAWERVASSGAVDATLLRRLEGARALLLPGVSRQP